jgi:hypothetical protein
VVVMKKGGESVVDEVEVIASSSIASARVGVDVRVRAQWQHASHDRDVGFDSDAEEVRR